jgi:hypothetical protein
MASYKPFRCSSSELGETFLRRLKEASHHVLSAILFSSRENVGEIDKIANAAAIGLVLGHCVQLSIQSAEDYLPVRIFANNSCVIANKAKNRLHMLIVLPK